MEIAVVGKSDFVIGFRLAGIRKIYETNSNELESKINDVLADRTVGILIINDNDMKKLSPHLRKTLDNSVKPTVIAIGGEGEGTNLREKIKQAIGVDLWK